MNMETLEKWLPMILYAAFSVAVGYFLIRYRRENDVHSWLQFLRRSAARASGDDNFRITQLRDAKAELAKTESPTEITPITKKTEFYVQAFPKFTLIQGLGGLIVTFLGLFQPLEEGRTNWMIVVGPVFLAISAAMIVFTIPMRRNYRRVQQMNRKFLLEKAGNDTLAATATLEEILKYYPAVPELWMEMADLYAKDKRLDDAVTAIKKAEELAPNEPDVAIIDLSFQVRRGNFGEAEKIIEHVATMKMAPSDPRLELYKTAIALKRNDEKAALRHAKKGAELDAAFSERFVGLDETLKETGEFMWKNKILTESKQES